MTTQIYKVLFAKENMKDTQVKILKADNEYELAEEINNSNLDIFATTPIQKNDGKWIAFIYHKNQPQSQGKKVTTNFLTSKKKNSTPAFIPTEEQLERWKKLKPTTKTINLLKKKGYSDIEIKHIKTQFDAHVILENLKKENI